eukprot:925896-Rhodomonas_salina.1
MVKIPLPLSLKFKAMTQRGIDLVLAPPVPPYPLAVPLLRTSTLYSVPPAPVPVVLCSVAHTRLKVQDYDPA